MKAAVDDDPVMLQALPQALRLRMAGVKIDTADSGAAALDRDRRPGLRRDRHRHQDAGDGRSRPLGRDPDVPARHPHPDDDRARRARPGGPRPPQRGLRLHPEADRPGLLRRVVAPGHRDARAESPGPRSKISTTGTLPPSHRYGGGAMVRAPWLLERTRPLGAKSLPPQGRTTVDPDHSGWRFFSAESPHAPLPKAQSLARVRPQRST